MKERNLDRYILFSFSELNGKYVVDKTFYKTKEPREFDNKRSKKEKES